MKPRALYVAILALLASLGVPHAAAAQGELFFTTGGEPRFSGGPTVPGQVNRVKVDGTGLTVLIADTLAASGANRPHGIAVDVVGGKIYYTNWRLFPGLHFANLDGSSPGSIGSVGSGFFHTGIAIDNAGGKLYTSSVGVLQIANLDGSGAQSFFGAGQRGEVELDLANGHVYWTAGSQILRANLDGTGIVSILSVCLPRGLEIDAANNSIYFTTSPSALAPQLCNVST